MCGSNIIVARHGESISTSYGEDSPLTPKGIEQMSNMGISISRLLRPGFMILESTSLRATQSTDSILNALEIDTDFKRIKLEALRQDRQYEPISDHITNAKIDYLIMTHNPNVNSIYEELTETACPFNYIPQGSYLHFKRLPVTEQNVQKPSFCLLTAKKL